MENVADPNIGGTIEFEGGWVRLTPAWHTAVSPNGTPHTPAGLVINLGGKTVYHLGDTGLFSDLALPGKRDKIDVALMCIGGHYTMDRHDAVAAAELVGAGTVIPCHYDTFPPIETDAEAFKSDVESKTSSKVAVLQPGETFSALGLHVGPELEPQRPVLPVVQHQRGARGQQEHAGQPVVDALAGYPEPTPAGVIAKEGCR